MPIRTRARNQRVREWLITRAPKMYWSYRNWRRGDEEPELCMLPTLCAKRAGSKDPTVVVDVGANYGMYTHRLVALGERAVAFEPIPAFAQMLRKGFGDALTVHATALSDTHGGEVELRLPHLYTGYATIEQKNELSTRQEGRIDVVSVPRATLDSFDLQGVVFMKIDVEGHEEAVLRGAEDLLSRCHPNLIIEVEDRHNAGCVGRILEFLSSLDYLVLTVFEGKLRRLPEFDLEKNQRDYPPERYARNIVCIPKDGSDALFETLSATLASSPGRKR